MPTASQLAIRDRLLAPRAVRVDLPGIGEPAYVRPMSVASLSRFLVAKDDADSIASLALLVALSACDESGTLLFEGDEEAAKALPFDLVKPLADAAMKANGIGEDSAKNP